jgi:hypothetical protein
MSATASPARFRGRGHVLLHPASVYCQCHLGLLVGAARGAQLEPIKVKGQAHGNSQADDDDDQ